MLTRADKTSLSLRTYISSLHHEFVTLTWMPKTTKQVASSPHTFTLYFRLTDHTIAYPYSPLIFPSVPTGLLCSLTPIVTIGLAQFWVNSFDDFSYALLGLISAMVTGTCVQVILKKTIGGLRPNFLAVCQPSSPRTLGIVGRGFTQDFFTAEQLCTDYRLRPVQNALESFPSGHAEAAFCGLGYLAIYLAAHLKVGYAGGWIAWRLLAVVAPIMLATYVSCTLVMGHHHRVGDVVFGVLIGGFTAVLGYGIVYGGVVDGRFNDKPLLRGGRDEGEKNADPGQSGDAGDGDGREQRGDVEGQCV